MARVTCRCGEVLTVAGRDADRLTCPRCGAKIRVRREPARPPRGEEPGDGYIRFDCPCGRRLKVRLKDQAAGGKCPDCGRIVPASAWENAAAAQGRHGGPGRETRTEDMDAGDLERLERWARRFPDAAAGVSRGEETTTSHIALQAQPAGEPAATAAAAAGQNRNMEAGLRVCPRCGKPLHMSASVCRSCGAPVPRR